MLWLLQWLFVTFLFAYGCYVTSRVMTCTVVATEVVCDVFCLFMGVM